MTPTTSWGDHREFFSFAQTHSSVVSKVDVTILRYILYRRPSSLSKRFLPTRPTQDGLTNALFKCNTLVTNVVEYLDLLPDKVIHTVFALVVEHLDLLISLWRYWGLVMVPMLLTALAAPTIGLVSLVVGTLFASKRKCSIVRFHIRVLLVWRNYGSTNGAKQ